MVGGGGGVGGTAYIHNFCSRMDFYLIFYCLEKPIFVDITNLLQLNAFIVRKPCGSTNINLKVVNRITTLTSP